MANGFDDKVKGKELNEKGCEYGRSLKIDLKNLKMLIEDVSVDMKKEKYYEIDSGNYEVCRQIATEMLEYLSVERKAINGKTKINQGLDFRQKVRIYNPEAMLDEDFILQNVDHDIIKQETSISCGDLILSDSELLARILDELR